ncbi:RNA polymerase sigma factor [Streptomyces sp. NPDC055060]
MTLLTGSRRLAFEAVDAAFHRAWQHWPQVATDPDPTGWIRARACDYALAPWHRLRPTRHTGTPAATDDADADAAWRAFLALPAHHRRVLLLCEGLGLDTTQAALEMEATTGATDNRLAHARTTLTQHHQHLTAAAPAPGEAPALDWLKTRTRTASTATLPRAHCVRQASDRHARLQTHLALALTTALALLIILTCTAT